MRISVSLSSTGKQPLSLPLRYRKNILSLVKEALQQSKEGRLLFQRYYEKKNENKVKPFTFSLPAGIDRLIEKEDKKYLLTTEYSLNLHFSSCDDDFLITLYNGLLSLKEYPLFPCCRVKLHRFRQQRSYKVSSEEIVCKTCSPILIRGREGGKGGGYLSLNDSEYSESFYYSLRALCRNFLSEGYELQKEAVLFTPVKMHESVIDLYGGEVAASGVFVLKAPLEVLQLVYDAGVGAKRSQGFGMIEVIG